MSVFGQYSKYYDLLYKDKDYSSEVDYVDRLLREYGKSPKTVLELGCGTGKHAALLSNKGYRITGVDISEEMLTEARRRNDQEKTSFEHGDIRTVRVDNRFDSVISLFHVISYQVTNEDVEAALKTAFVHLKPEGLFIFDVWYLPAVLTDRPVVRVKKLENNEIKVTRIAEPVVHPNENIVDVNYEVIIEDKQTHIITNLTEKHRMRYFSFPELEYYLKNAGFQTLHCEEWISRKKPGFDTWGVVWICKRK